METVKNIIIVESPNDSAFVKLLIQEIGLSQTEVEIVDLHKFPDPSEPEKELRGKLAIGKKLEALKGQLDRKYAQVGKIGILLDMDDWGMDKNLELVNKAVQDAFGTDPKFKSEVQFREIAIPAGLDAEIKLAISCFFTKGYKSEDGSIKTELGNLDTLLFAIRKNPETKVHYADCLFEWANCVNDSDSKLKVKPDLLTKMWLDNYLRAKAKETLGKEGKAFLNDFEARKSQVIFEVGNTAFDLKHDALSSFRLFLESFK